MLKCVMLACLSRCRDKGDTTMFNLLWRSPWPWRVLCIFCGLLGVGSFILGLVRGGWYVWLGIAALLVGLIVTSLVTRRW